MSGLNIFLKANVRVEFCAERPDSSFDKDLARDISIRSGTGDVWAWCDVTLEVAAYITRESTKHGIAKHVIVRGSDTLACCSYADEDDFRVSDDYDSMLANAFEALRIDMAERIFEAQTIQAVTAL